MAQQFGLGQGDTLFIDIVDIVFQFLVREAHQELVLIIQPGPIVNQLRQIVQSARRNIDVVDNPVFVEFLFQERLYDGSKLFLRHPSGIHD